MNIVRWAENIETAYNSEYAVPPAAAPKLAVGQLRIFAERYLQCLGQEPTKKEVSTNEIYFEQYWT